MDKNRIRDKHPGSATLVTEQKKAYLDGPLLEHLIGEGSLVEDDLSVHHVVDRLALHVGVEDLAPGHAGIERVPYLVPGHRYRDRTCDTEK